MTECWSGVIERLAIERGPGTDAASYGLDLGHRVYPLNEHIGAGFSMAFSGVVVCRGCARESRRSFGGGYCYDCFRTLARCDLCVLSPDRCHYHLGTCREPEWGESFCMQPHRVYLANSSGIKVGITRQGAELGRWLDQGAIQALVIMETDTRRTAGLVEAQLARQLPDRTDWRKMLRADVPELDLMASVRQIEQANLTFPRGAHWAVAREVTRLRYPLPSTDFAARSLKLEAGSIRGNLLGMKGQYLLLSSGALNIRQHAGYRVTVSLGEAQDDPQDRTRQLGLF